MERNHIKSCLSSEIFKCFILCLLTQLYIFVGAFLYIYIETCNEEVKLPKIHQSLSCKCQRLRNVINTTENSRNYSDMFKTIEKEFMDICSSVDLCNQAKQRACSFDFYHVSKWAWFCWNTISTIGYGSTVPTTNAGKICIMPYSVIGIALVLAFLAKGGSIFKTLILKSISFLERRLFHIEQIHYKKIKVLFATIVLIGASTFINAKIYSYLSGVDLLTSFYFYYITFSTIGYGEYDMTVVLEEPNWGLLIAPLFWFGMIGTSTLVQAAVDVIQTY